MFPLRKIKEMLTQGRDYFKELEETRAKELREREEQKPKKQPRYKKCSSC